MAWSVMSDVPNPLFDANGDPASGYVLKAYLPGTTTSTSIAINSAGSSPQASITANAEGKWEVSGNEILPYIDRKHKWGIFANSTHASANTPFYMGPFDNVERAVESPELDAIDSAIIPFATVAAAAADVDLVSGKVISLADRASSLWDVSSSGTADGYRVLSLTASGLYATLRDTFYPNVIAYGATGDGTTDDTGAIRAAFERDIAVCFPEPASFYKTTTAIMIGNGNARFIIGASRYTTEIKNAATDVFNVGGSNDATMFSMQELKVTSASGGGHCFDVKYTVSESTIENCWIKQENTAKSLWNQTTGYGGGNVVKKCRLEAAAGATVNPWYIYSNEIVNGLKFEDCRCDNSAGTKQFFFISSSNTSSYNTNCVFRDLTFELTYGGMIYLGGHQGAHIDNCHSYDMSTSQTGHGFYIGGSAGSIKSSRCKISRSGRRPSGSSLGGGICDIYLESAGASNTVLESCYNSVAGATFTVDFQNNKALVIDRLSSTEASYLNDSGVTYFDINGDFEGIVAPAYHVSPGLSSRELTIAAGVILPTTLGHRIDTEANAASDDLDTITATNIKEWDVLYIRAENTARTVVVKHGTGNIKLNGSVDFSLDNTDDVLALMYNGTSFVQVNGNNGT